MGLASSLPSDVAARLERLAPDQRAAATQPPGPTLCVAPAGSGKTTTLVARVAWRVATGTPPERMCAVTFNRAAAQELRSRLAAALSWSRAGDAIRVRTFHALGMEILRDAGEPTEPLLDRSAVLAELSGEALAPAVLRRLDDAFSRLKLDAGVDGPTVAAALQAAQADGPAADPLLTAFVAYEAGLRARGGLDFDDLVARAVRTLEADPRLLARWRARCRTFLVDEVQDVDRSQLRLALLLAAPANDIFLVGDDDQTIYAWRLADVRRVLHLAAAVPGLRRTDLTLNHRCPPEVTRRAVRLVEHNGERFAKRIAPGPATAGGLTLAADPADPVTRARGLLGSWAPALAGAAPASHAVLARTNAELAPYAAVALELGLPYRAVADGLDLLDDPTIPSLLAAYPGPERLAALGRARDAADGAAAAILGALLGWLPRCPTGREPAAWLGSCRADRTRLRRADAPLVLATAHGTKGLEFDQVAVVGLDEGRFPSARAIAEAGDPGRVLEEERRLAYVAWTRARRHLWLSYDPGAPSPFLREAFEPHELGSA